MACNFLEFKLYYTDVTSQHLQYFIQAARDTYNSPVVRTWLSCLWWPLVAVGSSEAEVI